MSSNAAQKLSVGQEMEVKAELSMLSGDDQKLLSKVLYVPGAVDSGTKRCGHTGDGLQQAARLRLEGDDYASLVTRRSWVRIPSRAQVDVRRHERAGSGIENVCPPGTFGMTVGTDDGRSTRNGHGIAEVVIGNRVEPFISAACVHPFAALVNA